MKLTELGKADRHKYSSLSLGNKLKLCKTIIQHSLKRFKSADLATAATGGKDSTLMLWLIKQVVEKEKLVFPQVVFIDEGDVFEETKKFINNLAKDWRFKLSVTHNHDLSSKVRKIGDMVKVADLNSINRKELKKLGFKGEKFAFEAESLIGNHLMKTVALNMWLKANKKKVLFVGVRWDEQETRSKDDFFRQVDFPKHCRVEPILHVSEKEVWQIIHDKEIPFVSLYQRGYRSLGAKTTTNKSSNKPAWEQDFKKTAERSGRQQDKEQIMEKLRSLGYM